MDRNVVFVCLDTVRKDVFDEVCSRISGMASVEFTKCRASAPCTVPSHANMLTGKLPYQHGVHSSNVDFGLLSTTFLDNLPQEYKKIGVSANPYFSPEFGVDNHFDQFTTISPKRRYPEGIDAKQEYEKLDSSNNMPRKLGQLFLNAVRSDRPLKSFYNTAAFLSFEGAKRAPIKSPFDKGGSIIKGKTEEKAKEVEEPYFMYVNFMDAHGPLYVHRELNSDLYDTEVRVSGGIADELKNDQPIPESLQDYVASYRDLYSASVEYLDRIVSGLCESLLTTTNNETTIIITADHGENLGYESENNQFGHHSSLSESLLRVPLVIINPPESMSANDHENKYISQLDIGRVIFSIISEVDLEIDRPRPMAEFVGSPVDEVSNRNLSQEEISYQTRMIRAVYEEETKYMWDSENNLFEINLNSKTKSRISELPEIVTEQFGEEISEAKDRLSKLDSADTDVSKATRERLEELGYV